MLGGAAPAFAAAALVALAACSFLAVPPLAPYVAATATATIYLGSVMSLKQRSARARDARRPPEAINISASKAWWLLICGSMMMALGVAYVLIKLLGNKLANYLQLLYFGLCLVGVADTFEAVASLLLPNAAESRELVVRLSPICEDLRLNALQLTCWFSAVVPMVAYYAFTKHWLLNNLIMVSLCQSGIAGLSFISTTRNVVFLGMVFVYNWVYSTYAVDAVAKGIDLSYHLFFRRSLDDAENNLAEIGIGAPP